MNKTELKKDFYKRFPVSSHRVIFSKAGLLCTLLGHSEIPNSEFISCTLSMCVKTIAHKLDHNTIKLENTSSGICTILRTDDLFKPENGSYTIPSLTPDSICGAEILYDDTIPQCFSNYASLRAAVLNTLLKLSDTDYSAEKKASVCAKKGNPAPYMAIFSSKKGWCNATIGNKTSSLPLPLTGYKLVAVQTKEKQKHRNITTSVEKAFNTIHRIYPHITTMNDLSTDMLDYAKSHLDSDEMGYMRHIISENERIKNAKQSLKACRINEFAQIVNSSQRSVERLWQCPKEHTFLCTSAEKTNYSLFARQWKNGIITAIEEDKIDYVIHSLQSAFSASFGYRPMFCISDTSGTE